MIFQNWRGGQWLFGTSENSSVLVAPTILNRNSDEIVSPVRSLRGKAEWALKPLLAEIAVQCPYLIFVPTHNNHWFCKKHCQGQGMQQHVTNGTTHPRVEYSNTKVTCSIKSAIKTGRGQSVSEWVSDKGCKWSDSGLIKIKCKNSQLERKKTTLHTVKNFTHDAGKNTFLAVQDASFLTVDKPRSFFFLGQIKHCHRHNGPEGWVHIARSKFTVHKSWTYYNFRTSIKH